MGYMVRFAAIFLGASLLTGCGSKSSLPESGLVLMAAPAHWEPYIGTEVQLIGTVSRTKVPTILGVEIDATRVEPGQRASATGIIDAIIVEEQKSGDPIVATRGPGTYYRLISSKTNKLAVAEPVGDSR